MKFIVYGVSWASGAPTGESVCKQYNLVHKEIAKTDPRWATSFEAEISESQLFEIINDSKQFDVLIWTGADGNKHIAFDGKGRHFRQR